MYSKCKNIMYKICISLFAIFWLGTNIVSYANLEDDEDVDIKNIKEEITVQTAKMVKEEPNLNARIGLIFDRVSKTILYEKNGKKQVPMASTTKIMTAIVVLENADLKQIVTVDKKAANTGGSRLNLKTNDKITVNDLLYGLMLRSGNDAAVALAIHVGGSVEGFAKLMNEQAKKMGLKNSHFITPHGLDAEEHYTTAYELACMADYGLNNDKFRQIVNTKTCTITVNGQPRTISNTNELLGNLNGVYGIKTGFTNGAGRCLVTSCKRGSLDIITVVLGADTKKIRTSDSIKLIEYANKNFQMVDVQKIVDEQFEKWNNLNKNRIYINKGKLSNIELELEKMKYSKLAIENTLIDNIKIEINAIYYYEAPLEEGTVIGNAKVMLNNDTIQTLQIKNKQKVEKKDTKDYFLYFFSIIP